MTDITIRAINGDELMEVVYWLDTYAFAPSPPLHDQDDFRQMMERRKGPSYFALYEGDDPAACMAYTTLTQQVRGAMFNMGGIMGVVTHPAARRKGYSRQLLVRTLAAVRENGRAFSCLYPFRESFYERLGYVTFPQFRAAKFTPSTLLPLLEKDLEGDVELVLMGEGYDAYRDYMRRVQQRVHGMALFEESQREATQRNTFWLASARINGDLVGLMLYQLKGEDLTRFNLRVTRFYYETSRGRCLLLAWIARHVDQAAQVEVWLPPFELPETWLADMNVTTEVPWFTPMGRIVDVAQIGGMHTGPGCFSARITDPLCPWNDGTWRFETVDGVLQVNTTKKPDCDLGIHALAALAYGTHDPDDFAIRGWGNPSPEVQEIMRTMFPPRLPYLHEFF